jgi:hypothetical protein
MMNRKENEAQAEKVVGSRQLAVGRELKTDEFNA